MFGGREGCIEESVMTVEEETIVKRVSWWEGGCERDNLRRKRGLCDLAK